MPELEQQIADWRKQMLAAGIRSPDPLNELECHLRDDLEHQIGSGSDEQKAFEAAVKHIGVPIALQREFQRSCSSKTQDMKTHLKNFLTAIALTATGFAFVLPVIAKSRASEALGTSEVTICTLGAAAALIGVAWAAISAVRLLRQRSRA
jgi:hypothetical protein